MHIDDNQMRPYIVNISSLSPINVIQHREWYDMCWQVLDCHGPFGPHKL
jgi:hypothetical protein